MFYFCRINFSLGRSLFHDLVKSFNYQKVYVPKNNLFTSLPQNTMLLKDFLAKLNEKIPLEYASDWDNVGLLIEPCDQFTVNTVLLTNDLTEPVLDEAINKNCNLIISYHPPIFHPLKSITQKDWKERIVTKCLTKQIAVYSPHTALDAIQDGINDWLLKPFDCVTIDPIENTTIKPPYEFNINLTLNDGKIIEELRSKNLPIFINQQLPGSDNYSISCGRESLGFILDFFNNHQGDHCILTNTPRIPLLKEGMGRIGKLTKPMTINQIVKILKKNLGLDNLRLALSNIHNSDTLINSIGVCAGSGASLLRHARADFFITGEMSHHEILNFVHRGISVVLCEHSNTERGYLKSSFLEYLNVNFKDVSIIMSEKDKDPIIIV